MTTIEVVSTAKTIDQMLEASLAMDEKKTDILVQGNALGFTDRQSIIVPFGIARPMIGGQPYEIAGEEIELDDLALSHLAKALRIPANYLHRCPGDLQAHNLAVWAATLSPNKRFMLRVYNGSVRAIVSEGFSTSVSNTSVLRTALAAADFHGLGQGDYELTRPWLSPDLLHMRVLIPNDGSGALGDNYGYGGYFSNGEIRNRRAIASSFLQRHSCTNSSIMRARGVDARHFRNSWGNTNEPGSIANEFFSTALSAFSEEDAMLMADQIKQAKAEHVDIGPMLVYLATKLKLNQTQTASLFSGAEGITSRYGIANALSFAAHDATGIDLGSRIRLEELSGEIMTQPAAMIKKLVGSFQSRADAELETDEATKREEWARF